MLVAFLKVVCALDCMHTPDEPPVALAWDHNCSAYYRCCFHNTTAMLDSSKCRV